MQKSFAVNLPNPYRLINAVNNAAPSVTRFVFHRGGNTRLLRPFLKKLRVPRFFGGILVSDTTERLLH